MVFMLKSLAFESLFLYKSQPPHTWKKYRSRKRRDREEVYMGNSLRCCLACVLPCGALDVVRVVHLNGQVEEYCRQVFAGEVLAANPNHVLSKPCSQGVVRQILAVSPDSELKRGGIYFLIPAASSIPEKRKKHRTRKHAKTSTIVKALDDSNRLAEILSEKKSGRGRHRSGRVGAWRPHLESICEDPRGNWAWE